MKEFPKYKEDDFLQEKRDIYLTDEQLMRKKNDDYGSDSSIREACNRCLNKNLNIDLSERED